jgi:hypothetical protein
VHLFGFIIEKFVTMHRHKNVKFVIRLLWADVVRGAGIHACLCPQYGDSALPRRSIKVWVEIFKNNRISVTDAERSGRPSAAAEHEKQEEAGFIILADRRLTTAEIALQLGVSQGTVYS